MKKTILSIALAAFSLTALAQQSYKGDIIITPTALQQRGDSLYVNFNIAMRGLKMATRQSAEFTPVLVSANGEKCLPKILINGRNNYKSYKRNQFLAQKSRVATSQPSVYDAYRAERNDNGTLNYNLVIPFEEWMSDARLDIRKDDCGCGDSNTLEVQQLVSNVSLEKIIVIEPYSITPHLAYKKPEIEAKKSRAVYTESLLDFAVGKTTIDPNFGNNPKELAEIRQMIEGVIHDKYTTIKNVSIIGYASPEGSLSINKRLSEGRAKAMQHYIESNYDLPVWVYHIDFGGEDWDGLFKQVEASDISYKQEILDIIQNTSIENGRETKLMALQGGNPYKYMLKEMFPALRRVICKVDYVLRFFNLEQAKEIIKSRPQNLSLNEMYMVSEEYKQGSEEFNELFETAVRLFPDDETANLNAAASALSRKDLVSAEKHLSKVKTKMRIPEYDNSMGVLMMLKGDYDKAEQYLKAAQQAGVEAAKINMEELDVKRKNMQQIELQTKSNNHK